MLRYSAKLCSGALGVLWKSCGIVGTGGDRRSIRRRMEAPNPCAVEGVTETETTAKDHLFCGHRLSAQM